MVLEKSCLTDIFYYSYIMHSGNGLVEQILGFSEAVSLTVAQK